jgi:hypothetical protein
LNYNSTNIIFIKIIIIIYRWSALTAFDILTEYKEEYLRLVEAFREGLTLEECISVIEGTGAVKITN